MEKEQTSEERVLVLENKHQTALIELLREKIKLLETEILLLS